VTDFYYVTIKEWVLGNCRVRLRRSGKSTSYTGVRISVLKSLSFNSTEGISNRCIGIHLQ